MRRLQVIAASAALAALVQPSAGCTVVAAGTATPAPDLGHAPKPLSAGDLTGLLTGGAEADAIMGAIGMQVVATGQKLYTDRIADPDCLPLWSSTEQTVYDGSGWTAVRDQDLRDSPTAWRYIVQQAVVSFTSAEAAAEFYTGQVTAWSRCDNRHFSDADVAVPDARRGDSWLEGVATEQDGVLTARAVMDGDTYWACQRALGAAVNVVIDVKACSENITDQGAQVVRQTVEKINARR